VNRKKSERLQAGADVTNRNTQPITEKQKQARRENGKKGKGPTSDEGKARSSQNAIKHGYYTRGLAAIETGPLREDSDEFEGSVTAFFDELDPGDSLILIQAALDLADKAWRLTRAQRWEAHGYSLADYLTQDAARAAWLRDGARRDRRHANTVRSISDPDVSPEDLAEAFCRLAFAAGMSEEDLEWVDDADEQALVDGLVTLIDEYFEDHEGAASFLEAKALDQDSQANSIETTWRPSVIRNELDGAFARNAERMVSHASREYDRSLSRYEKLKETLGDYTDPDSDGELPDESSAGHADSGVPPSATGTKTPPPTSSTCLSITRLTK
jgi:hypothetical protein